MKKFLLLAMLAGAIQLVKAQDFKKVQTTVLLTKWEEAKTEIDRLMLDPKSGATAKAEGWYWKSRIYAALAKEAATRAKYPTVAKDADEAFRKYAELDPTLAMVKEKGAEGYFDMYSASYNNAIKVFNEKKWEESAHLFESAIYYINNVIKNKWTNANIAFDTTSLLYAGYSFQNANKLEDAAKYYSVLADAKIGGDLYKDIYKYLVTHYTATKNDVQFKKYLAISRELYPTDPWDEYEIDFMDRNNTLAQKTEIYDKEDAAGTLSEMKYLQFGDVFINAKNKTGGLDSLQQHKYALKAADAFKKAYAKNNQNAIAAFNVGVIYYNVYGEYDDIYAANIRIMQGINADKPAEKDPKKKAAAEAALKAKLDPIKNANATIEKPMMENLDYSLEWLEKSYTILKNKATRGTTEKSVINKSVDFLANMYAYKRDRMRGKDSKAFDAFDAKFKEYDSLHGKF